MNKIIRSAYGTQTEYQELSFEAIDNWNEWNAELASGNIPPGMSTNDAMFYNIGAISMNEGTELPTFEKATIEAMAKQGREDTQLATTDPAQVTAARQRGFNPDPFNSEARGAATTGVLDTSGGHVIADKACRFALHKAKGYGARFVFDPVKGAFKELVYGADGEVKGIRTQDGQTHHAKLTIMACGGWTPSLVPQLDGICETTAGSVVVFQIPKESPLFDRFAPGNFPVWMFRMRDGARGGLYGFPRDENGYLKFGYRGTKYTNPQLQSDGVERSVPITRWSEGDKLTEIPRQAMAVVKGFVAGHLPELVDEGLDVAFTRVCWYTDTFDNHFIIDRVPEHKGLMVATGGSGHAFKYLPNIGNWIVDIVEGVDVERPAIKAWRWRKQGDKPPYNVIMEGSMGPRALQNVPLTTAADLKMGAGPKL